MKQLTLTFLHARPAPSWLVIPRRITLTLVADMKAADLFKHASAMAYVTLFSVVPSLAAVFSLISVFMPLLGNQADWVGEARAFILENLAAASGKVAVNYFETFLANLNVAQIGLLGFAGVLVTFAMLLNQIEDALNRIWLVHKGRNLWHRFIFFWTFLTLGAFILSLAVAILTKLNLAGFFGLGGSATQNPIASALTPALATLLFFFLLYRIGPNASVKMLPAAIGAIVATLLIGQAGQIFSYYVGHFTSYQSIYGALAAVPVFLLWLYVAWIVILFGAVVAWRCQQGFSILPEASDLHSTLTAGSVAHYQSTQLNVLLPAVVVAEVYSEFSAGTGKGISGHDIAVRLGLPVQWVIQALYVAEELHLVIGHTQNDGGADAGNELVKKFFPALPTEKLTLGLLIERLSSGTLDWLKKWNLQHDSVKVAIDRPELLASLENIFHHLGYEYKNVLLTSLIKRAN